MCTGNAGMPRTIGLCGRNLEERESNVENGMHLARIVDDDDGSIPHRSEGVSVADSDESGKPEGGSVIPTFRDDFGTDSGRIP